MDHGKKYFVGGLINVGAGLAQAGYGLYQERQAKKRMAQADGLAEGPIRTQAARQRIARQTSDSQAAIDAALRAEATAAEQLARSGGSRGLVAGTPRLLRATERAVGSALDRFGALGAQQSQMQDQMATAGLNAGRRANFSRLQRAADAARSMQLQGVAGAIKGGAEILGGIDFAGAAAKRKANRAAKAAGDEYDFDRAAAEDMAMTASIPMPVENTTTIDQIAAQTRPEFNITEESRAQRIMNTPNAGQLTPGQISDTGFGQMDLGTFPGSSIPIRTIDDIADYASKVTKPRMGQKSLYDMSQLDAQTPLIEQQEEELDLISGVQPMEEGGKQEKVEKTPGDFDHDDNPIDIVQDGDKIGEMTGGEYIFNPEQAEEMRKLSKKGSSPLHKFIRNLLSKEQFQ